MARPDFDGARKWIDKLPGVHPVDVARLQSWVDKVQVAFSQVEREVDSLERQLAESAYEADRVEMLEQAISDHRLRILDTDELHRIARRESALKLKILIASCPGSTSKQLELMAVQPTGPGQHRDPHPYVNVAAQPQDSEPQEEPPQLRRHATPRLQSRLRSPKEMRAPAAPSTTDASPPSWTESNASSPPSPSSPGRREARFQSGSSRGTAT